MSFILPSDPSESPSPQCTPSSLGAVLVVAALLTLTGPLLGDVGAHEDQALGEGASLANQWMGLEEVPSASLWESSPLSRLLIGTALVLNPTHEDGPWARAMAGLLLAFSWWGLGRIFAPGRWRINRLEPWLLLGLLMTMGPFRDAAAGYGAGAVVLATLTLAGLSLSSLSRAPALPLSLGLVWGLVGLVDPLGLSLGVPIFALAAWAYGRGHEPLERRAGDLPLPAVPLALLVSPLLAALTMVALGHLAGARPDQLLRSGSGPWALHSALVIVAAGGALLLLRRIQGAPSRQDPPPNPRVEATESCSETRR